jgi:hypothetical protein
MGPEMGFLSRLREYGRVVTSVVCLPWIAGFEFQGPKNAEQRNRQYRAEARAYPIDPVVPGETSDGDVGAKGASRI